jgi:hypothetical protein
MTQPNINLTTIAAWGASEGISRQAAHLAVKRCGIPLQDGRLDPAVASALYRQRTRPRARTRDTGPPPAADLAPAGADRVSYQEAKRRQAVADAIMAEREQQLQAGELTRVAEVKADHSRLLVSLRDAFMNIPPRLAAVLAAETDARVIATALEVEIAAALRLAADY